MASLGGFIARYIHGPLIQAAGIIEDKLAYMRWERQQRFMRQAEQILKAQGLSAPTRAVPLKIAVPILQAASMEEDDQLQDRWANLLVNAANASSKVEITRAYISILEQLTSLEVRILDVIYANPSREMERFGVITAGLPDSANPATKIATYTEPGKDEPSHEIKIAIENLCRVGCLKPGRRHGDVGDGESFKQVYPSVLGEAFVIACSTSKPD